MTPQFWMNLQAVYDLEVATGSLRTESSETCIHERLRSTLRIATSFRRIDAGGRLRAQLGREPDAGPATSEQLIRALLRSKSIGGPRRGSLRSSHGSSNCAHPIPVHSTTRSRCPPLAGQRLLPQCSIPRSLTIILVVRHTRMTLTGFGRFDLAYFRHTNRWFTVYRGSDSDRIAFERLKRTRFFWPTT